MASLHWPDAPELRIVSAIAPESPIDVAEHARRIVCEVQRAALRGTVRSRSVDSGTAPVAGHRIRGAESLPSALRFPYFEDPA